MLVLSYSAKLMNNKTEFLICSLVLLAIGIIALILSGTVRMPYFYLVFAVVTLISVMALVVGIAIMVVMYRDNYDVNLVVLFCKYVLPSFLALCFWGFSTSISKRKY